MTVEHVSFTNPTSLASEKEEGPFSIFKNNPPLFISNLLLQGQENVIAFGRRWVAYLNESRRDSPSFEVFEHKEPILTFQMDVTSWALAAGSAASSLIGASCLKDRKRKKEGLCFILLGLAGLSITLYRSIKLEEK